MKKTITTILAVIGAIVVIGITGPITLPILSVVIAILGTIQLVRWMTDNKTKK